MRGYRVVSWAPEAPPLTFDGPKVDIAFPLASGEGHDVLGAVAMGIHGAQLLDALVGQHTNPAPCGDQHGTSDPCLDLGPDPHPDIHGLNGHSVWCLRGHWHRAQLPLSKSLLLILCPQCTDESNPTLVFPWPEQWVQLSM